MSLNKFMHPRNRYKYKKPDFKALAQKYPEFKVHVIENEKGKPVLNFENPDAVRVLTTCLLQEDYGLNVEIPPDRLVPTLPLRLNYVHWIEDIASDWNKKDLSGIDIGTGTCCIYPILAISGNPWRFLATEADELNWEYAVKNIKANKLTERINVVKVSEGTILEGVISGTSEMYDFCMCNPPFFADHFEAQGLVSRKPTRPSPKTMSTASPLEGIVQGGEIAFVRKMIEESNFLQGRVRLYSTMLGKKTSLAPLKEILRRYKVENFASTEFCQGKTMRWGLAWSFDKAVRFPKSEFNQGKKEGKKSVVHIIPTQMGERRESINNLVCFFRQLFSDLKVHVHEGKQTKNFALLTITAAGNTWIHSRRKRRQMMRQASPQKASTTSGTAGAHSTQGPSDTGEDASGLSCGSGVASRGTEERSPHGPRLEDSKVVRAGEKGGRAESKPNVHVTSAADSQKASAAKMSLKRKLRDGEDGWTEASDLSKDAPPAKPPQTMQNAIDFKEAAGQPSSSIAEPQAGESMILQVEDAPVSSEDAQVIPISGRQSPAFADNPKDAPGNDCDVHGIDRAECASYDDIEPMWEKDRPPAQYVLKCHMSVRVQDCDLAVKLTWLGGEDIQFMHQLMQVLKNRLTSRKPF